MKTYITFGQVHIHKIQERIIDKDCVVVITTNSAREGRERAFELFGSAFSFEYPEKYWDESKMRYFPRGYIHI